MVSIDTLKKVLELELQKGCTDRAVGNGLEAFVERWQNDALKHSSQPQAHDVYTHALNIVRGYGAMPLDERKAVVEQLIQIADGLSNAGTASAPAATHAPALAVQGAAAVRPNAEKAQGPRPTREGFMNALDGLNNYDTGGYLVSFSPQNHNGSSFVELTVIGSNLKFNY